MHGSNGRDIDDQRPWRPSDIAADERNVVVNGQREQAVHDLIERGHLERIGKRKRQQRCPRPRTHRREVAQVDGERPVADCIRRHESAIEVHALDLRIDREDFECATHRLDCGCVVAGTDDHPGGRGHPSSNARDERVLTALGHCRRIQSQEGNRPALPCGEVE